jgi:uncharacterized protein (TIGR00162 family)
MNTWRVEWHGKRPKLRTPVLVEGLPGIGNVAKLAADFMSEELGAKKIATFISYAMPHSVFVNEKNLVELPSIELYYKHMKNSKHDILILVGDVQPLDEESCYAFSEKVLEVFEELGGRHLVTLGGIAMRAVPKKPRVFCTGTDREIIGEYLRGTGVSDKLYGVVGPIIGVSGVLLGLAGRRHLKAVSLLAETYGHPLFLGVQGASEILKVLNKKLNLKLNVSNLDKEIVELESQLVKKTKELAAVQREAKYSRLPGPVGRDTSYIG